MAFLDYFRRSRAAPDPKASSPENPSSSLSNPASWLLDWSSASTEPLFGSPVNERNAMQVSAVYRCVSLLAGIVASLPLGVYQDDPKLGRVPAPDHRLDKLFSLTPFPGRPMNAYTWKELSVTNILLEGNALSAIRYDGAARVVGFEWINPATCNVLRRNDRNSYEVHWPYKEIEYLDQEDVLHMPGPGWDGIAGQSRVRYHARNAIALNRTLESATGIAHDNAVKPSVVFKLPQGISADAIKRIAAHFTGRFAGRANVGKPLFLDNGTEFQALSIPLGDLATIDAMKFSVADISRFFGVPLALLNESEGTTAWGSGIDSLIRGFLRFTLDADLHRIEAELNAKLFADSDYYALFDRDALLTMDPLQAAQATSAEINSGILTVNEARQRRHRPVVEGGDIPLVNSTLVPLTVAVEPPPPPAAAPPSPPDAPPPSKQDTSNDPSQ